MTDIRIPRGYGTFRTPFNETQDGQRPTFQSVQPALFLPVAKLDQHKNDPIVLLPGTFVGRLALDASGIPDAYRASRPLVPACPRSYTVTYTSTDLDSDGFWNGGTPDLDSADGSDKVAAAGASSDSVPATKPVGVIYRPIYASWLASRFTNYNRNQPTTSWLAWGRNIEIPAQTDNEKLIEIGDLVCLDVTTTPSYNPLGAPSTHTVGRLQRFSDAVATFVTGGDEADIESLGDLMEYVVGRCVGKHKIVSQSSVSAGQTIAAARAAVNLDKATLNSDLDYNYLEKVQTVPGLGVAGSGSTGIPPYFDFATADANGDFWALEIEVRC
jgi:hypothetical protein